MENVNERIEKVDFIRGIAMIFVICGHAIDLLLQKNIMDQKVGKIIFDSIYSFHMPLFFMISGYVAYKSQKYSEKLINSIVKNLISIYIPYLFLNYLYLLERVLAQKVLGIQLSGSVRESFKEVMELSYVGA